MAHGIFVLGVVFAPEEIPKSRYQLMKMTIVPKESKAPEDAKILAQANLQGGGNVSESENPSTPFPAPFPDEQPKIAASSQRPAASAANAPEIVADMETEPAEAVEQIVIESSEAKQKLVETIDVKDKAVKPFEKLTEQLPEKPELPPTPSAIEMMMNSFKIASLSAQLERKLQDKSERPRRKYISATTKEYKYASYMEAWRTKVERVGNLNYPEAARRDKLSGKLSLDVSLNSDGSIEQITIVKSSGHQVLDDAAIRIVKLASPYSPFPDQIREETDILHIIRTWKFSNHSLSYQ